ncbi:aldose epimerase family protein [Dyella koreensis]|uniref:Aldose 1-epimerase n=1 Tax=Dyella koreensis TaxID=311235 RepID=A0ABW8JZZ1_9GAMM
MTRCVTADAAAIGREIFGTLADGTPVEAVTLSNRHGLCARIIALGATLQSLTAPDRDGTLANITLGYASLDGYVRNLHYFGATVGRYANRIARGRFVLDGEAWQLPINNPPNSLHGGTHGFDKVVWIIDEVRQESGKSSVGLSLVSPDGDMGYPGTLRVTATYTLDDSNRLSIEYGATTDKSTVVNLTHHAYWNLAGEGSGSAMRQLLTIPADAYLPVNDTQIPTGEIRDVTGTAFDFRQGKPIGRDIRRGDDLQLRYGRGYDHSWVIGRAATHEPRMVAKVEDPLSGRVMTLLSTKPGLQFYSGNFLDGTSVGTGGYAYRQGDAFALEPQFHPDTPNQPAFGSARLAPGQTYRHVMVYEFTTQPDR